MSAQLRTVRQCRRCKAVTGEIRAKNRAVHVNATTVLLYPVKHGRAIGYTLDGRMIRGEVVSKEQAAGMGVYEVFLEHKCANGG